MKAGRKVIVYVATSADGYIARADGSVEWLDRPRPPGNYGMGAFLRSIDTILWGRRTYDLSLAMGSGPGGFGPTVKNYVFTHRPPQSPAPGVEFVSEPVGPFVERLRTGAGKDVWVMGGGGLIASLLDVGAIDAFILHVVPVLIGEGIPLVQPRHRLVPLALRSVRRFTDGVVRLHYGVPRLTAAGGAAKGSQARSGRRRPTSG
jgi:dihydrofolate reductase